MRFKDELQFHLKSKSMHNGSSHVLVLRMIFHPHSYSWEVPDIFVER